MKKRPSKIIVYVLIGLVSVFGIYILGGLILDAQPNSSLDDGLQVGMTHDR
ncbi:MAG: hypothetical protein WBA43_05095 [Elainellaceae cyanobacterium]